MNLGDAMRDEAVAIIPYCAECKAAWLPTDTDRWRAYLGCDEFYDAPEVHFYCPRCATREFGEATD